MITKYTTYIKESLEYDSFKIVEELLNKYTINSIEYEYKWYNVSNMYELMLIYNGNSVITIITKPEYIRIEFFSEDVKISLKDFKTTSMFFNFIKNKIIYYLDNYYEYLKVYLKNNNMCIYETAVIDKNKFLDFIEYVIFNNSEEQLYNTDDIIEDFINTIYHNEEYEFMKEDFDKRFSHIINANNFDLI